MKKKITAFLMTASFLASNTVFAKDREKEFSKIQKFFQPLILLS